MLSSLLHIKQSGLVSRELHGTIAASCGVFLCNALLRHYDGLGGGVERLASSCSWYTNPV